MGSMQKGRLTQYKQARLVEHFVAGTTEQTAAFTATPQPIIFLRLREIIAYKLEADSEAMFEGEIEVDESYFGGNRKGKRGRGAAGKIPVFGLSLPDSGLFADHEKVKRSGKVYTKIIPDVSGATLIPIIERKVVPLLGDCFAQSLKYFGRLRMIPVSK